MYTNLSPVYCNKKQLFSKNVLNQTTAHKGLEY